MLKGGRGGYVEGRRGERRRDVKRGRHRETEGQRKQWYRQFRNLLEGDTQYEPWTKKRNRQAGTHDLSRSFPAQGLSDFQDPDAIFNSLSTSLIRDQKLKIKKSSFAGTRQLWALGLGRGGPHLTLPVHSLPGRWGRKDLCHLAAEPHWWGRTQHLAGVLNVGLRLLLVPGFVL